MRNNNEELRLMEELLGKTRLKPRCPFLKEDEFFSGDVGCKCEAQDVDMRNHRPIGYNELQLCTDETRHRSCIHYKKREITWDQLNEMTLDMAEILTEKYGIDGYQYNECLNLLRNTLARSLDFHGYKTPGIGYVNWRELRKARDDTSGSGG